MWPHHPHRRLKVDRLRRERAVIRLGVRILDVICLMTRARGGGGTPVPGNRLRTRVESLLETTGGRGRDTIGSDGTSARLNPTLSKSDLQNW